MQITILRKIKRIAKLFRQRQPKPTCNGKNKNKHVTYLRNDDEPGVDGDMAEAFLQSGLHIRSAAMVEPQRQQAQYVLQGCSGVRLTCQQDMTG